MREYQEELGDEGALGEEERMGGGEEGKMGGGEEGKMGGGEEGKMGGGEEGKMENREWAWTSSEEPDVSECPPGYPHHPIQCLVIEYRTD